MKRDIKRGTWFKVESEAQHKNLKACGKLEYDSFWTSRVQIGTYDGPGWYKVLSYQQKCPRGCCYDSVHEVIPAADVENEIKDEMKELAWLLKEVREKQ
jgi:hypothetical protein